VRSDNGMLGVIIDGTFEDLPAPDVIVFPGGVGTRPLQSDTHVLDWVRSAHASTTFTTSVCTGSLVLGAAGLLDGLTATTHWGAYSGLAAWGATPQPNGWSSTPAAGSSPQRACPPGSTWRHSSPNCSLTGPRPKQRSC
jgi:putative intracellular protease/amidase